jgi:hypothetical protein|uniref:Uncharacterized protein n=1 Tax=Eutreptiella gymnastica TaxID=73025 RepID=A0A7S4FDP8_9EUGL|mmetsp:Transcript_6380/g.11953  ORF Transcript_6380/g.11953 Transcript_6380/m.11953 type:complete len:149 (-) Transcript_6380:791-1237(-)
MLKHQVLLKRGTPAIYKRKISPVIVKGSLSRDRLERNLFQYMGCKPWFLPGHTDEWNGAKVTATLNVKPTPMKFNGTLLDRRSAGKSSRLNATIKVYEPDETGTDNPRIYTFPMDNPYLDVTIEKVPDQMNHWKQTMREWVRVRTTKP